MQRYKKLLKRKPYFLHHRLMFFGSFSRKSFSLQQSCLVLYFSALSLCYRICYVDILEVLKKIDIQCSIFCCAVAPNVWVWSTSFGVTNQRL